jgi:CDP-diacylglycerol--glycerol-3-phosphate 3-phosphatidyltransferase
LPNALTSIRIAAVPVLIWLLLVRADGWFAAVLIATLVGDVVDGLLARALGATSALGALLDSVADTLLFFVAIAGLFVFHAPEVAEHPAAFAIVPAAWLAENLVALARYGRLSSFHTLLSRAAAVAMSAFVVVLFAVGLVPALLHVAAALVLVATAEEFVLLWLLPEWTPDVRGLYWLIRKRTLRSL